MHSERVDVSALDIATLSEWLLEEADEAVQAMSKVKTYEKVADYQLYSAAMLEIFDVVGLLFYLIQRIAPGDRQYSALLWAKKQLDRNRAVPHDLFQILLLLGSGRVHPDDAEEEEKWRASLFGKKKGEPK